MSKWGIRLELSEAELRETSNTCTKELIRRLQHGDLAPDLAGVVRKTARALVRVNTKKPATQEAKETSPTRI